MFELYFKLIAAIGILSTFGAVGLHRYHNEHQILGLIGLAAWAVLAFTADALLVSLGAGETTTVSSFPMQLIALLLAVVSAAALYGPEDWPGGSRHG